LLGSGIAQSVKRLLRSGRLKRVPLRERGFSVSGQCSVVTEVKRSERETDSALVLQYIFIS
jgi:hypothetical protein